MVLQIGRVQFKCIIKYIFPRRMYIMHIIYNNRSIDSSMEKVRGSNIYNLCTEMSGALPIINSAVCRSFHVHFNLKLSGRFS